MPIVIQDNDPTKLSRKNLEDRIEIYGLVILVLMKRFGYEDTMLGADEINEAAHDPEANSFHVMSSAEGIQLTFELPEEIEAAIKFSTATNDTPKRMH